MPNNHENETDKVTELPTGSYDAVRTLRHLLQQAERGDFDQVAVICMKRSPGDDPDGIWAVWSDMIRMDVHWMASWFKSFITHRYFGRYHGDDD